MKILVTGAAGMLGTSLVPVLRSNGHTVLATDIVLKDSAVKKLDVRIINEVSAYVEDFSPDMIMHLAAETDLETCEQKQDYAFQENFIGTQNVCRECAKQNLPITYISTAGVFDGTKSEPYTEFDEPNPINVYGASKLEGERIVRETIPAHYIVRAGWMIGGGERDKKFVHKIIAQLDKGVKRINAVNDRFGTPTYAPAFSKVLAGLIGTGLYGTYHLACKGRASRFDVAAEMLNVLGRQDIELNAVSSEFFKEEYFAPRPRSEEMLNYVLELRSMNVMPFWKDALREYLETHFGQYIRR